MAYLLRWCSVAIVLTHTLFSGTDDRGGDGGNDLENIYLEFVFWIPVEILNVER